jgi:hypothetical protein
MVIPTWYKNHHDWTDCVNGFIRIVKQMKMMYVVPSVSNGSGLPSCGLGLEPDQMVQSGLEPGEQGYPASSGTGWNRSLVPSYGSYTFGSN